ncbi:hypothetical protein [Streptomyces sp. MZ04]|uniref:hypothetical protein n=1 Tax=Streptomyces sp. MZ04 TaxID=2559236 RepID=UPI00107EA753|nr:hypothetical protein [Streptomyces sp. MZ04]TGB13826.1 hypothetical protein E2651_07740 [Streptomyces sp. MZ04]
MIVVTPPSPRALAGSTAPLIKALQDYAEQRPGGDGGAMLEVRDEHNQRAISIICDAAEMNELAARLTDEK